jgi:hypothetical protein
MDSPTPRQKGMSSTVALVLCRHRLGGSLGCTAWSSAALEVLGYVSYRERVLPKKVTFGLLKAFTAETTMNFVRRYGWLGGRRGD